MLEQEDSPKRRSTFYVSLDGESRQGKIVSKTISHDAEKYCNTFPIGNTTAKTTGQLQRTLSNHDALTNSSVVENNKRTDVESRGKVQSLTRIFEASKVVDEVPEQQHNKKKVERTRSFKTIERFQSRFTGKKDSGRKDNRLNNTITCITDTTENYSHHDARRKIHRDDEEDVERTSIMPKIKSRSRESRSIVEQKVSKQNSNSGGGSSNNNNNNNTSFANLIRRTHSTKLARSTSALVRAGRQTTIDDSSHHEDFSTDHEKDNFDDTRNECPDGCVFKETDVDGGIHSGDYLWTFVSKFINLI